MSDLRKTDGDVEFTFDGDIPPCVPPGDYEVGFLYAHKHRMFGDAWRLFLWFQILAPGEWHGQRLYMACTVPTSGKWGPSHKFFLAWVLAAGKRPNRADRMSTNVFRNKAFRARVRVVTKTAKQAKRTPAQQYSVIDELLEVLAGDICQSCA